MTLPPHSNQSTRVLLDQMLQEAITYSENNQFEEAEKQYQALLEIQADHPEANYFLGLLALQRKQPSESLPYFETALDKRPEHGPYWLAYIDALDQAGQSDVARQVFEIAQQAGLEGEAADTLAARLVIRQEIPIEQPDTPYRLKSPNSNPVNNISPPDPAQKDIDTLLSLYKQDRITDCENLARSILSHFPDHGFSWKILGAVLQQQNRLDEATAAMKRAVILLPQDSQALNNLGLTLKNTGNLGESESTLRLAIDLSKDFAEAHNNLGVTLMAQGRLAESAECFRQALDIQPEYAEAYCNLGINLKNQGHPTDSETNLRHALKLSPSYTVAWNNLGNLLQGQGRLSEAEACLHKALELKPDFAIAYNNLANTLHCQGHLEEAERCYHKALELKPDYTEAYDGLLFVSNYHPDKSSDELFQLYRKYDERFGLPHQNQWKPHSNNRDPDRRLKIGYVSPSFYSHPVFHFLEPLLSHHDKSRVEVFAYSETLREDPITICYKHHVDHWIPTIGLSDDALAERIQNDGIDILIDLAGHTGRNRLAVFARKPAPVSLHWLDFGYTTGLSAIDYYLTDIASAPIGSEHLFSERLWRLPTPAFAYRPSPGMGHVSPLPATQRRYVTFGTLTRAIRINHRTIRVWSEILRRIEGSRLVIDSGNFKDPAMQEVLKGKFIDQGINADRLEIGYHSPPWDILRTIDIGLDCFPHNSGTTLFENLYMGVPFITLADRPSVGMLGSTVLEGVGHPEWIARSENEYIEKTVTLASDISKLADIRAGLRVQMQNSPLMDEQGFTERVEDAYRKMFRQWCTKTLPATNQIKDIHTKITQKPSTISDNGITLYNLGVDFQIQGRLDEAKNLYLQVVNLRHDFVEAYNNLGAIFQQEGSFSDAEASFIRALAIKPDYAEAYYNLATTCKLQQKFFEAEANYRKALAIMPDYVDAHYQLGNILQEEGRPQEAEVCLRQALALKPDHIKAFSTLLFALNYHPDKSSEEIFQAYKEFNVRFCLPHHNAWLPHTNSRADNRLLKVGYVAPDYRKHPARYFLEPLLAHHDKRSVETYAYVELSQEEAFTDLFHGYVDHWIPTTGLTDEQLSQQVRNDAIDILVDLAGHTAGNRLGVFARKPAPVSLHWLDFGYTTGLTAIDYYLTDHATVPNGSEPFFSETPWRLETPALAYRPPDATGPVNVLPAQKNGYVTFGSLSRAVRINHRTIRVWSEILKRCAGARLIINSGSFRETAMQEALTAQFFTHGIEQDRLTIGCNSPPWNVLRTIDIGLDCFPHNSGTTLIESLYMGVPYITLAERPSVGRLGSSILQGIGHPEWIADTEDEYILKAVTLAADWPKLAAIRTGLREEMVHSSLMDGSGFAGKVESAYREMFKQWCDSKQITGIPMSEKNHAKLSKNRKQKKTIQKKEPPRKPHSPAPPKNEINRLSHLFNQGSYTEATKLARSLTTRFPHHGFGWKVLGPLLHQQGLQEEAIRAMDQAVHCLPNDPDTHYNLGIALEQSGLLAEAEQSYRRTLHLNRNHNQAVYNLGNILKERGQLAEAESCYRQALKLRTNDPEIYNNLGNILKRQGNFADAEFCYRKALSLRPDSPEILSNLGFILKENGEFDDAEKYCRQALQLNPNLAEAYNNLGIILARQNHFQEAEVCYRRALEINPDYAEAYCNLVPVLGTLDRITEAEACYQKALKCKPDFLLAHSNLLFLLNYDADKSGEEIFEEYIRFNAQFGLPLQTEWRPYANNPQTNRRLKVGYVSSKFCKHSTRHFLEPLLAHHDKTLVNIYAYTDLFNEDEVTARYRLAVENWVKTTGLSDAALAERIRTDNIDILVDLDGHTGGNRLGVFARKPAPVSIHWLDFGYTTGLTAIDYYLTDEVTVPAGSEDLFSETPWRIATPCLAYRPAEGMGAVSPLPALKRGHVTFGTLTRALRINHRTIRVWSEILRRVEGSHLVIDSGDFKDSNQQTALADKFVALGIDRERLKIGLHSPPWDLLRDLDIGLDCFPHNSGTTLFETLYMGSPFITLADRPSVGRLGSSILEGFGHPEWIASTEEEYINLAVALASDLPNLEKIRKGLRQEMERSPLMDEAAFARKAEDAYQAMFQKWSRQQRAGNQPDEETDRFRLVAHALQQAISCHQSGLLYEAEELYLSLLNIEPNNPEANFHLGLLMVERQQPALALPSFVAALDARPDHGPYWLAYIDALDQAGQSESARQLLDMAIDSGLEGAEVKALESRLSAVSAAHPEPPSTQADPLPPDQAIPGSTEPPPDDINRLLSFSHQGKYVEGEALARSLSKRFPGSSFCWKAFGLFLKMQGRLDEAVSPLQQALLRSPQDVALFHDLGDIFQTQGHYPEAVDIYKKGLEHHPAAAKIHYALANTLISLGRLEEAEAVYRRALELKPDFAEALCNLGNTLQRNGKVAESEACYRRALEVKPDFAEASFNLGNLFREQNRLMESQAAYEKALQLKPDYHKACSNLGITLQMLGRLREAEDRYHRAVAIQPDFIEGYVNLGACLKDQGRYREAEESYQKALAINPDFALCHSNLGSVLKEHGQLSEAEQSLRRALELNPDYAEAHSNLLFLLNYDPDRSGEDIYAEYQRFNARFGLPLKTGWQPHPNSHILDRRLKIGYVSPQFRKHSIRHFLEPLLAHHDKEEVEIFAYADVPTEDAVTARYHSWVDHWRMTAGLSDAELAQQIRADGIDILVELAGHTANNRLLVFARKPAPVSLHWLDFGYTTGLTAIDYYLTDKAMAPVGCEGLFAEKPWRVATPALVYRPAEDMGETNLLPATSRNHVTFGTLTRAVRINHRIIRVWSEILKQVAGSQLVIDSSNFIDTAMQEELAEKFFRHGIDRQRLVIGFHSPPWDVLRTMDICLDCFPHNSGTTLFETLYMGVPFITLADRPSVGRLGCSILEGVGHPEWIAETEEEYIELAVALATDLPKLTTLRSGLREEMQQSPLMDEPAFTRKIEAAYREIFAKWCLDTEAAAMEPTGEKTQKKKTTKGTKKINRNQTRLY